MPPTRHLRATTACRLTVALVLAVLPPALARAAPPVAAIRYVAPPECPDASAFRSLLGSRTAEIWTVRMGDQAPDFLVEIRESAGGKVGSVRRTGLVDAGAREITAADCRDLVQALALSTALSLGAPPAEPAAVVASAAGPTASSAGTPSDRWSWMVGGGLLTTFLFPSQPMPEGALFVELGQRQWSPGPGLHAPDVRLVVSHARNDLFGADRARFSLSTVGLTLCPLGVGFGPATTVRLCGAGEVGVLSGGGIAVSVPRTSRFLFATGGAIVRLRWAPGRRAVVEAQAGIAAPLERTTFVFEMPRLEVAKVPALVGAAGVTVGFVIP